MTCVVALECMNEIYVACDSASTEFTTLRRRNRPDEKVFSKIVPEGGTMLIGFSSSWRIGQLIKYNVNMPKYKGQIAEEYMVTSFVPALQSVYPQQGSAHLIVAFLENLFVIDVDLNVEKVRCGFASVGSGSEIALGSMYTTQKYLVDLAPEERLSVALKSSAVFNAGVAEPFSIFKHSKNQLSRR